MICRSYAWTSDSLKMLPLSVEKHVRLALDALARIYPKIDLKRHIIGDPITVSWEDDPNLLGAFKGALAGDYRYNRRMFCQFVQDGMPPE